MNFPGENTSCWPRYPQTQPELLCPCLAACTQCPSRLWSCFPAHLPPRDVVVVLEGWGRAMGRRLFMGLWPHVNSSNFMPDAQHHAFFSWWRAFSNVIRSIVPHPLWPCTFNLHYKAGSCSSPLSERTLPGSVSASAFRDHTEFSTGARMHVGVLLAKPRLTLATASANMSPARTGLCLKSHSYIITFSPVPLYSGLFVSNSAWP